MRTTFLILALSIVSLGSLAQPKFKLHVQPGKEKLTGDGDDYTTIVVTARNDDGEIMTNISGKVQIRVSSGFPDEMEMKMESGVAMVKYTAPMFGTPINASQRMVYFLFRFMEKFISRSAGSTDYQANQKLATNTALETFKEGYNPLTMIHKKDGDNYAYIVCEMNGVRGGAKIEIQKAVDGRNGSIVPGMYYGRDITGQSSWFLDITSGGEGTFGEATGSAEAANTILFTTETFTEFNDVMGKMAGMGGFMKAYLGPPASETRYVENYDIRQMGMPSAYMPMPKNGVFVYVPPILFEYAGRKTTTTTSGGDEPVVKTEKTGIIIDPDKIIGDGRTTFKAVFHYEDDKGAPVSGKNISWSIPKDFKIISTQNITDASGNALAVLQAPLLKATGEKRGENTGELIDNYELYKMTVRYSSPKRANDYTETNISVYKTIEAKIHLLKPGFEQGPVKLLLPQLENYTLEGGVYALIQKINSPAIPDKVAVNDIGIVVEGKKFDQNLFKIFRQYSEGKRKEFITLVESAGGFIAYTNAEGKFKLKIGQGPSDKKLPQEPFEARLSDLTGHRKGELGKTLVMFNDPVFQNRVIDGLFAIDNELCKLSTEKALMSEEKLHIIGMLMVNANNGDKLIKDTGDELIGHGWELLKTLADYVNKKLEVTKKLSEYVGEKTGYTAVVDSLTKLGMKYDNLLWKTLLDKGDYKYGTKKIIQYFLAETVLDAGVSKQNQSRATVVCYKLLGEYGSKLAGMVWDSLSSNIAGPLANYFVPEPVKKTYDKASKAVEGYTKSAQDYIPDKIKEAIQRSYYNSMKGEIVTFFGQSPENVHQVYPSLYKALRDTSTYLRSYYSSIAAWRYNAEMLKAYTDLTIDVVVKAIVIFVDAKSGKWTDIPKHLKKLDEAKEKLATAFTGAGFAMELYRLNNLWTDVLSSFSYANLCISRGSMQTSQNDENQWSIFPAAYAAPPGGISPLAIALPGAEQLKYSGKGLPVNALNELFDNSRNIDAWIEANSDNINRLAFEKPEESLALLKSAFAYRDYIQQTAILTIAIGAEPQNTELISEYNETVSEVNSLGKKVKETASAAALSINKLPSDPRVNILSEEKPVLARFDRKILVYIGSGAGFILLVVVLIVFIRRRRRKSAATSQPAVPVPSQTPLKAPPASPAPDHQVIPASPATPKFCPHCGTPLTQGKKFCGKCGYKIQ